MQFRLKLNNLIEEKGKIQLTQNQAIQFIQDSKEELKTAIASLNSNTTRDDARRFIFECLRRSRAVVECDNEACKGQTRNFANKDASYTSYNCLVPGHKGDRHVIPQHAAGMARLMIKVVEKEFELSPQQENRYAIGISNLSQDPTSMNTLLQILTQTTSSQSSSQSPTLAVAPVNETLHSNTEYGDMLKQLEVTLNTVDAKANKCDAALAEMQNMVKSNFHSQTKILDALTRLVILQAKQIEQLQAQLKDMENPLPASKTWAQVVRAAPKSSVVKKFSNIEKQTAISEQGTWIYIVGFQRGKLRYIREQMREAGIRTENVANLAFVGQGHLLQAAIATDYIQTFVEKMSAHEGRFKILDDGPHVLTLRGQNQQQAFEEDKKQVLKTLNELSLSPTTRAILADRLQQLKTVCPDPPEWIPATTITAQENDSGPNAVPNSSSEHNPAMTNSQVLIPVPTQLAQIMATESTTIGSTEHSESEMEVDELKSPSLPPSTPTGKRLKPNSEESDDVAGPSSGASSEASHQ